MNNKKQYYPPRVAVENFIPNEYVAVCWKLTCKQGLHGDPVTNPYTSGWGDHYCDNKCISGTQETSGKYFMDHTGNCSTSYLSASNGETTVREISPDQGPLVCYNITPAVSSIKAGSTVTWDTFSSDNKRRWHHSGTASEMDSSHPNMS